ncbi:hypothetical protein T492DRAFT_887891, partial [Pavlovales sp. CCMP2436]
MKRLGPYGLQFRQVEQLLVARYGESVSGGRVNTAIGSQVKHGGLLRDRRYYSIGGLPLAYRLQAAAVEDLREKPKSKKSLRAMQLLGEKRRRRLDLDTARKGHNELVRNALKESEARAMAYLRDHLDMLRPFLRGAKRETLRKLGVEEEVMGEAVEVEEEDDGDIDEVAAADDDDEEDAEGEEGDGEGDGEEGDESKGDGEEDREDVGGDDDGEAPRALEPAPPVALALTAPGRPTNPPALPAAAPAALPAAPPAAPEAASEAAPPPPPQPQPAEPTAAPPPPPPPADAAPSAPPPLPAAVALAPPAAGASGTPAAAMEVDSAVGTRAAAGSVGMEVDSVAVPAEQPPAPEPDTATAEEGAPVATVTT